MESTWNNKRTRQFEFFLYFKTSPWPNQVTNFQWIYSLIVCFVNRHKEIKIKETKIDFKVNKKRHNEIELKWLQIILMLSTKRSEKKNDFGEISLSFFLSLFLANEKRSTETIVTWDDCTQANGLLWLLTMRRRMKSEARKRNTRRISNGSAGCISALLQRERKARRSMLKQTTHVECVNCYVTQFESYNATNECEMIISWRFIWMRTTRSRVQKQKNREIPRRGFGCRYLFWFKFIFLLFCACSCHSSIVCFRFSIRFGVTTNIDDRLRTHMCVAMVGIIIWFLWWTN